MNCRSFETPITELARGQMLEARLKEGALAHLKGCRRCAARFADEQALTAGLRSVAAKAASTEAPARVENFLLSSFRQRAANSFAPVSAPAQMKIPRRRLWSIAAAAAILIASTLAISRLLLTSDKPAQREAYTNRPTPLPRSTGIEEAVAPTIEKEKLEPFAGKPEPALAIYSTPRKRRGLLPRQLQPANEEITRADEEIATDFMPLTYAGGLSQTDGGQVVRVELPRSALQSFGLPVNAESAGERVKADVLLGHDGVARAIRFVR